MGLEGFQQPQPHKAKICMWKYLDVHSMDLINKAGTTDELKSLLSRLLDLQDFETNRRSTILLDLYFYTIQFCREQGFNREQTSAFFSIVKDVHEACVETPLPNVEECYNYFSELVFCHSIRRPPFSIDLFNQNQLVRLTDYMINTYFRHYKLYKYAFTPQGGIQLLSAELERKQFPAIPKKQHKSFCSGGSPNPLEKVRLDVSFTYIGMPEPEPKYEEAIPEESETGLSPLQEDMEETTIAEESPTAVLREFIANQLTQELTMLRLSVDQRLKATEDQFNAKLLQLEKGPGKGGAKGKKK